jgi:hypothetical protein
MGYSRAAQTLLLNVFTSFWSMKVLERHFKSDYPFDCRESSVGIATRYGLDDRGFAKSRWGQEFSLLHVAQTGSGAHPMGRGSSFPGGIAAGSWSWPLTSNLFRGQENVDLYIHSPIRLHVVVLNYLSTKTNLPLPLSLWWRAFVLTSVVNLSNCFFLRLWKRKTWGYNQEPCEVIERSSECVNAKASISVPV